MSRAAIKHPIQPALQKQGRLGVGCFFVDENRTAVSDPNVQLQSYTTPENRQYDYGYDAAGRLDAVNLGPDGLVDLGDYLWDKPRSIRYGLNTPAASETQTLDGLLRRQQTNYSAAQSGSAYSLTYGYNNENHIETITGNPQGDLAYGYDEADRLTSAARTSQTENKTEHFSYDNAYNRQSANDSQYSYSTAHNGLLDSITTQNSTTTFIHDANGHRTTQTNTTQTGTDNWTYEYNAQERLTRITKNNIEQATYKYNAQGQRIQKTTNTGTTFYLYNSMGLAAEYDQTGTLQKEYGYLPDQPYMTNPVFLRTSTSFAYYQNDHLGTPQRLIDKQGITVWQASYDAFGKASININTVENNLRFVGQYYNSESGLHQNWFRDYDPKTGRYIERDPVGLRGGINTYAYVMGNPVSWGDPLGLKALCEALKELQRDKDKNPFLNWNPFFIFYLGDEPVPLDGHGPNKTEFTGRDGFDYDIQYIQVGYAISRYGTPIAAAYAQVIYNGVAFYKETHNGIIVGSPESYFDPDNIFPNYFGLYYGATASPFGGFDSLVDHECGECSL